jgi:hypothetical protein
MVILLVLRLIGNYEGFGRENAGNLPEWPRQCYYTGTYFPLKQLPEQGFI